MAGKCYCSTCAEGASECGTCHHTLHHRLVVNGLCNACRNERDRSRRSGLGSQAVTDEFEAAESLDPLATLTNVTREIKKSVYDHNIEHHGSKWYVTLHVTFVKRNNVGERVEHETSFRGEVAILI